MKTISSKSGGEDSVDAIALDGGRGVAVYGLAFVQLSKAATVAREECDRSVQSEVRRGCQEPKSGASEKEEKGG